VVRAVSDPRRSSSGSRSSTRSVRAGQGERRRGAGGRPGPARPEHPGRERSATALVAEFVGATRSAAGVLAGSRRRTPTGSRSSEHRSAAGDAPGAEAAFTAALARDPRHPRALLGLARMYAASAQPRALGLLERVSPSSALAHDASVSRRSSGPADATGDEAALRARVAANLEDLDARLQLGRCSRRAGSTRTRSPSCSRSSAATPLRRRCRAQGDARRVRGPGTRARADRPLSP
jgi:hypothetical protein